MRLDASRLPIGRHGAVIPGNGAVMDVPRVLGDNARAVEIRLLGPLTVVADGGDALDLGGGRQRAVLALLALRAGRVVSSDELIEALWGDAAPPTALKALQNLLSQLRRALEPLGADLIGTRQPGYVLAVDPDVVDVHRFERLARTGRQQLETDPGAAAATLREALGLWRAEALAEFAYASFAQAEIRRLDELRVDAYEDVFEAELAVGRAETVVAELRSLVAANPVRERLRAQLMLALYRSGRQAESLDVYREGRALLLAELGLEPGYELKELEQAILRQDPALGGRRRSRARPARGRGRLAVGLVAGLSFVAAAAAAIAVSRAGDDPPVVVPDSLVKIDAETNSIVGVVRIGRDPGQVEVVGKYVFVTSQRDKVLHRLDPSTGRLETTGAHATDGALAATGPFLWATSTNRGEVVRIHTETLGAVARVPLARDLLHAFVAVGGGSLWISQYPPAEVLRLNLRTLDLERRYALGLYEFPVEITYADGAAWVATGADLVRIDGTSGTLRRVAVGPSSSDPAYGFGSMWAGSVDAPAVWRVDTVTGRTVATVATGRVTFGLAAGAGSVWVTNYCDGTVSRIDPADNTVVATIRSGFHPKWLAVGARHVWVGVSDTTMSGIGCD